MVHMSKPRAEDITEAIRKRICLQPNDEQKVLLEGTLAAEFGVSRTPVRQVLQRLAYEGLIEVRSGVGSVVMPLNPAERDMHIAVHCGLLRLVANLVNAPVPQDIVRHIAVLCGQARSVQPMDADATYTLFTDLNALLSRLIRDPVIADAHLVSGWRIVRWFLTDLHHERDAPVKVLLGLCQNLQDSAQMGRAAMFEAASDTLHYTRLSTTV